MITKQKNSIKIDCSCHVNNNILGVGVEWDPQQYEMLPEFTDEQWNLIYQRLDFFELKFARVMIYSSYSEQDQGVYQNDYLSSKMKSLYKVLDYCQRNHVVVMLGIWNKPEIVKSYDDPAWIRSIADMLDYLYEEKKYDCVKYFNYINEPNGDWEIPHDNWLQWRNGVSALYHELLSRGILDRMKICGPDSAYNDEWVDMAIASIPHVMGDYEYHIYLHDQTEIVDNKLEMMVSKKRRAISDNDPDGKHKKLWLGEFGCRDGKWNKATDCQNSVYDFIYGVWIADAVVQILRAGLDGIIPWDMDDAAHPGAGNGKEVGGFKRWGFWNTYGGQEIQGTASSTYYPPEDRNLRPWFYPMSLFSKLFKQGGSIVDTGPMIGDGLKVCAYKTSDGNDMSIAIVNALDKSADVSIRTINGFTERYHLNKYVYFENNMPVDANGFAVANEVLQDIDLAGGLNLNIPGRGVIFLSTL